MTHKFPRQPFSQLRGQPVALVGPLAAEIRLWPLANQFSPLKAPPSPTLDPKKSSGKLPKLTHENRLLGRKVTPTGVLSKGVRSRGGGKLGLPNWPRRNTFQSCFQLATLGYSKQRFGKQIWPPRADPLAQRLFDTAPN